MTFDRGAYTHSLGGMTTAPTASDLSQPFGCYAEVLARWATAQPQAVVLRDDAGSITWSEFDERTARIAAGLVADGLERGQAVAILGTSTIAYALGFLGAMRAGGVAAPLTTSASADQLKGMATDSGARHIFIDRAKLTELGPNCFPGMARVVLNEQLDGWMAPTGTSLPHPDRGPAIPFMAAHGDLGREDATGFVERVGLISGGFNIIFPVDLEAELLKESDVAEAAVIGMPSRRWGETPVGFVTLRPDAREPDDIRAAVNARLGKTQRLSALHAIEAMPRSHIGKLLKTELRDEAARRGAPE